jgi:hypothetical protein
MERLLTVEFGPSRSKRFAKAVALAQSGPGQCAESEPGRYRVTFLLASEDALYSALGRLLERVRHWRATEVYEGDELVSTYQAKDIKLSECPKRVQAWTFSRAGSSPVGFAHSLMGSRELASLEGT